MVRLFVMVRGDGELAQIVSARQPIGGFAHPLYRRHDQGH
jgi:hypothetical protein